MTDYRTLELAREDGLARITLALPPHNILNIPAMEELNTAIDSVAADGSVRVLLLTGAGEKAFSAGVEVGDHTADKVDRMVEVFHGIFRRLERLDVPTVAALNGVALGGGCELALACDMIVAAEHAKIGQPEIRLGVFPPVAAVLLPRLVPPARAMELLLGGGTLTAAEALAVGLVNRVLPREVFAAQVGAFVEPFLRLSGAALKTTKRAVRAAAGRGFDEALAAAEHIYLDELMKTADAHEGLASFMEKRAPVWTHR